MKTATAPDAIATDYGTLEGVTHAAFHENGRLARCTLRQPNTITLPCGTFVPQYEDQYDDERRRKQLTKSLTFYEDGTISSMVLQDVARVKTSIGHLPAEMVSFHENGAVKRIFPTYGTISAFWTEVDERRMSPDLSLDLPTGIYNGKAINLTFYPTGQFKSITLWPGTFLTVPTPLGDVQTRIGLCLYEDGSIKSIEPNSVVNVPTTLGTIPAFDPNALGMDGGTNSLVFGRDGSVESLFTSTIQVSVTSQEGTEIVHAPAVRLGHFADVMVADPMKISFSDGHVRFGARGKAAPSTEYRMADCTFSIDPLDASVSEDSCDACQE